MAAKEELINSLKKQYDQKLFAVEVLKKVFGNLLEAYSALQKPSVQPNQTEKKVISDVGIYGKILLDDGVEVLCYEIKLKDHVRIDQSKVAIQHYVRKLLTSGQAALVNFISPTCQDIWRFTLVAKDSELTAKGIQEKATHPKRYTFLVESGANKINKTLAERLEWLSIESDKSIGALVEAFSVEKMSKLFFDEYKEHYQNFVQYLTGKRMVRVGSKWEEKDMAQAHPFLKSVFNGNEKNARDFCKKLLGRIIFLYFVQKKRWLGASTTEYEDGSQNFIFELFEETGGDERFFPHGLTELFFNALNTERPNDDYVTQTGRKVKIPYLNGGLFTRDEVDELIHRKGDLMTFPAELFSNPDKKDIPLPKGATVEMKDSEYRGFLDFLNAFNFTVYEDSQDDQTVAVDPEMLGHIFENLLEDNKDKGAYYTPKEIVSYMCQESLVEYLKTHLAEVGETALEKLVREKEVTGISKSHLVSIDNKLKKVKICDPAIGSGAFPMGLLQEIFSIREIISYEIDLPWDPAKAKEDIIQNSIYGVDIEKGAVDIARLRFWLSLVVDKEKPKALPNLDYKIVVGDSLLSKVDLEGKTKVIEIDWSLDTTKDGIFGQQLAEERLKIINDITEKQKSFFHPNVKKKELLKHEIKDLKIDLLIKQLEFMIKTEGIHTMPDSKDKHRVKLSERYLETIEWKNTIRQLNQIKNKINEPFQHFDWKLDFPEVLNNVLVGENTGFDIVIGNPPWGASYSISDADLIKKKNREIISRMTDSFMFFINESFKYTKKQGVVSKIVPEVVLNQQDNQALRVKIINEKTLQEVVNLGDDIFEGVTRASCIIQIKNEPNEKFEYHVGHFNKINRTVSFLYTGETVSKELVKLLPNNIFPSQNIALYELLDKIHAPYNLKKFLDLNGIQRGVSPDLKKAFVVDESTINTYNLEKDFLRKTVTGGKEVKRYYYKSSCYVIYTKREVNRDQIPNILNFLSNYRNEITCKEVEQNKHPFYSLHRSRDEEIFIKNTKILGVITGDKISVALDEHQLYPTDGLYLFSSGNPKTDKALVGILNSKFITLLYQLFSNEKGKILAQIKPMILEKIPIPDFIQYEKIIGSLVDYISFLLPFNDVSDIKQKLIPAFFEQIVDGIIYEIYFPQLLKKYDREIIKHLGDLPELSSGMSDDQKMAVCREVFQRLDDKDHPVRNNIFYLDSIPEIAIIEGKQ